MKRLEECGKRLRQERERLKYTQDDFAAAGGVKRVSQYFYETGSRSPSLDYLLNLESIGVDLAFVIFGAPSANRPPPTVFSKSSVVGLMETGTQLGGHLPPMKRRKLYGALYDAAVHGGSDPTYDEPDAAIQGA